MTVGLAQAPRDRPAPPGAVVFIINQSAHCAKVQSRMLPCPDIYPPDIYIPENASGRLLPPCHLRSGLTFGVSGTNNIAALAKVKKGKEKGSPFSITERRVPELIPVLGSQPVGDVSHKPGGRLPLLSARPAVTPRIP